MARRPKRGPGGSSFRDAGIPNVYEGPHVLSALLERAGSPLSAADVASRFRQAQGAREERGDVVPSLFPVEPRFGSPDEARRLYGNLFALWDRIGAGLSISDDAPAVAEPLPAAALAVHLPPRGAATGRQLTPALIEAVWKHLDLLPERERRRLLDRFETAQPDLFAWIEAVALPDEAALAARDLAFETWAMFDVAFGDRVGRVEFQELRQLESEPPALESSQPALAAYVAEALDLVAEEDPNLGASARAQVERVMATAAEALADSLAPLDDA